LNTNLKRTAAALGAAALMAMPAGAMAKSDHSGSGKDQAAAKGGKHGSKAPKPKKPKTSTYVFTGLVTAVGEGTVSVEVRGGNSRGKKLKGQTLTFDVTTAKKLKVADANEDGKRDLADVAVGDRVLVQAKLARGAVDAAQALPARQFVDKGPAPVAEPSGDDDRDDDESGDDEPKTDPVPETPPAA
jgi:hypothetical protein